jgi:hypothetical protein
MTETSIVAQITSLRQQQDSLFAEARERRADLLAELATLCGLLGPLTRDDVPAGVLRRRPRRAAKAAPRARKPKVEEAG